MQTLRFSNKIFPVYFPWAKDLSVVQNMSLLWKSADDLWFLVLENWGKTSLQVLEKSWNFFGFMVYEPCKSTWKYFVFLYLLYWPQNLLGGLRFYFIHVLSGFNFLFMMENFLKKFFESWFRMQYLIMLAKSKIIVW